MLPVLSSYLFGLAAKSQWMRPVGTLPSQRESNELPPAKAPLIEHTIKGSVLSWTLLGTGMACCELLHCGCKK